MAIVKISLVRTSRGCKVVPPIATVQSGDSIKWSNRTGGHTILMFPHDGVFGAAGHFHSKIADGADHMPANAVTAPAAGAPRNFPFSVYCDATRSYAEGSSDPEIIIEA